MACKLAPKSGQACTKQVAAHLGSAPEYCAPLGDAAAAARQALLLQAVWHSQQLFLHLDSTIQIGAWRRLARSGCSCTHVCRHAVQLCVQVYRCIRCVKTTLLSVRGHMQQGSMGCCACCAPVPGNGIGGSHAGRRGRRPSCWGRPASRQRPPPRPHTRSACSAAVSHSPVHGPAVPPWQQDLPSARTIQVRRS